MSKDAGRLPHLYPDYVGITFPPNIAPLNFRVDEPGTRYRVEIRGPQGSPIAVRGRGPEIRIPPEKWKDLILQNSGGWIAIDISVYVTNREWLRFESITNYIGREKIDGYLAYRLLKPLYNVYVNLGIYQRDLGSFRQQPILENSSFGGDCLNCHTFLNHSGSTFAINIRASTNAHPMLLTRSNQVARVDKTMGYLAWHPSGKLLTFTSNKLTMLAHTTGEARDVYDAASDLGIYDVRSNRVHFPAPIAQPQLNENWPNWSPDGRYLYFSRAIPLPVERFQQIQYDLVRVAFDIERNEWGVPEVLVSAKESGLSANQPKVSPDGRFVLFCLSAYGNFPVYQPSSDLYLYDLKARNYRRLPINSLEADSWHCWSANGRWIVFSSKRLDGLFARPFFSYFDEATEFHKPFVVPQEDPGFYESYLRTFNLPELIEDPVTVSGDELARAVVKPRVVLIPRMDQKLPESSPGVREAEASMFMQGKK